MQQITEQLRSNYDELQYLSSAFAVTRPDNLNLIATLAGLSPAPVENCRVLEIGCAAGRNLLPMAQALPGANFLGIDLSAKQIATGTDITRRAALKNVELRCQDILQFEDHGAFDYIIAHGIYSWVPPEVRDHLIIICQRYLAPRGVAYISYNTWPGWHIKRIARDLMRFHSRDAKTATEKLTKSRAIMQFAAKVAPQEKTPYREAIRMLSRQIANYPEYLLAHDELEVVNDPVFFEDFVRHAESHDLRYLGGAQPATNLFDRSTPELRAELLKLSTDPIALEQYADFMHGGQYRDSLLCHRDADVTGAKGAPAVQHMHAAALLIEGSERPGEAKPGQVRFANPLTTNAMHSSNPAVIAMLRQIAAAWPRAVAAKELLATASAASGSPHDSLLETLLFAYHNGVIELWTRPTPFIAANPEFPFVTPLARLQAAAGGPIINLRHEEFRSVDRFVSRMIPMMDGTRNRRKLKKELAGCLDRKEFALQTPTGPVTSTHGLDAFFDNAMQTFSNHSLFVQEPVKKLS